MIPADSFPFDSDRHPAGMGIRALAPGEPILQRDADWAAETALKAALLTEHPGYYFQALPGTEAAQREAARLLGLPAGNPALAPLDAAGRAVQEDLLLLGAADGQPLLAGQLCFANGWCLEEKLGQPLLAIHDPVPGYRETLGTPTGQLLERLKPGRPVWRRNWAIRPTPRLDLSSRWNEWVAARFAEVTPDNVLTRCLLRVERQTLAALPETGAVLFTIHTYQQPLGTLTADERRRVAGVLRTAPSALIGYKGLTRILPLLLPALEREDAGPTPAPPPDR